MQDTTMDADVIVVGAGPTGLMLAGELRLGGAEVIVLDKLPEPTGQSRGLGFTARAMEVFDQRGLLPRFGQGETLEVSPVGHFGGVQFDFTALQGAHFGARGIPQSQTEAVLAAWATDLGAEIRRGYEVLAVADGFLDGDHVEVTVGTADGVRQLRAPYLVGCDGGKSTVRKLVGIDFPGTEATRAMFLADVTGLDLKPRYLGETLPNGMVMAAPLGEGVHRIIVCPHGAAARSADDTVTFEEVAKAWEHITGEDISGGGAEWVSFFSDATRQAAQYRRGRVLLAGDAAHIHLPAGGQGLSTGVQDAANLGWKLAAVVTSRADEALLDTYHAERHPVGRRLLMNTRAQGMVFLGGDQAEPLRRIITELTGHDTVRRHLAGIVSHLDIRYDGIDGSEPGDGGSTHPLLGRRLGKTPLTGPDTETDTFALLHAGHAVLLDLVGDPGLREAAAPWAGRVDVVTVTARTADRGAVFAGAQAVLVRPDGHVAWTGAGAVDGLATALARWFGEPAGH
ncbi:FAD-dependent monooxygenase [Streptomyces sp. NBC_01723]|uniref:FAD-dependent monooxygenase n=2 Tax=Streptomyces TaxID=1883 RepID=UPI00277F7C69|nr:MULTISPECIES: FAD-dependent monooxygenase [unclassified Streptomyces]MDQ0408587.1 bifunctional hydroxylase/dehydrase [Streptomyces sp. DSM 40167]